MNLWTVRTFAQQTIAALHDAGMHREAFQLGDALYGIRYQPIDREVAAVAEQAERMAALLPA